MLRDNIKAAAVYLMLASFTGAGYAWGNYVGKLQAVNTMYKVELEKAQQAINGDIKIMKAYKEGQK